jgi:hypothetical protein
MRTVFTSLTFVLLLSGFGWAQESAQVTPTLKIDEEDGGKLKVVPDKPVTPTPPVKPTPPTKGHWECKKVCVPECYRKCLKWRVRYVEKTMLVWVNDAGTSEGSGESVIK